MPKNLADRIIMFCVIGIVVWAIIGLPTLLLFWREYKPWLAKDAAGFFTCLLFVVGVLQAGLFIWQLTLIRQSLNAQKEEFLASHRPRIRIKHLWLIDDIWQGQQIVINVGIVNNGIREAILNTMGVRFVIVPNGRPVPFDPYFPNNVPGFPTGQKLPVGVWMPIENITDGTRLTNKQNVDLLQGRAKLYCIGYVSYLDGAKKMRITGFCRVLEIPAAALARTDNCRFREFDDPDYQYED